MIEEKDIIYKKYDTIHHWISYHYGKATKCENKKCKLINPKRYEWALKKGKKYEKNINNFKQLCASCHRKYDFTEITRKNFIKSNWNNKKTHCKYGHKFDKKNTYLRKQGNYIFRGCRKCIYASVYKYITKKILENNIRS